MHRTFIPPRRSKLNPSTQQEVQLSYFPLHFGVCVPKRPYINFDELVCQRVGVSARVSRLFAPRYFRSSERKFPLRTFAPGNESSRELSFPKKVRIFD